MSFTHKYAVYNGKLVYLAVNSNEAPPDDFWDPLIQTLRELANSADEQVLLFVDAPASTGRPTSEQIQRLKGFPGKRFKVALISDSMVIRGAIKPVKWMGYKIEAYPSTKREDAMFFLGLYPEERAWLEGQL